MARIQFKNDVTKAIEELEGSDGRANVSSRTDGRKYYNARDRGQTFLMSYSHPSAAAGEYSFYLQNTSDKLTLVVSAITISADDTARVKLWHVTGTAADGVVRVPHNTNFRSGNIAAASTALHDGGGTTISGLSVDGIEFEDIALSSYGREIIHLEDAIRLGQSDAIALEVDLGASTPDVWGSVFILFE